MNGDPLESAFDELSARVRAVEKKTGDRLALGEHPDDERIDCRRCRICLAIRDIKTGEVRVHYNGLAVRFTAAAGAPLVFHCRRCGHDQDHGAVQSD